MTTSRALTACALGIAVALAPWAPAQAEGESGPEGLPFLITTGDPLDPKFANAGENLRNGVGSIFIEFHGISPGGFICTASAIDAEHILTAAHCVTQPDDAVRRLRFILNAGLAAPMIVEASGFAINPLFPLTTPFLGAFAHGDIAVVTLATPLPPFIDTYEMYTGSDELGKAARHYGHGRSGKGNKGATGASDFFFGRTGLNTYEQFLEPLIGTGIEDQLLLDFDSGGRKHNAMAWWFSSEVACHPENPDNPPQAQDGQCTTFKDGSFPDFKGFGKLEIGIAPGDSGGPSFIDGKIAGVHSFGFTHSCEGIANGTDFTCGLDSSYGEMSGDTRVSSYAGWVDAVVNGIVPSTSIPEPVPPEDPAASQETATAGTGVALSARGRAFVNGVLSRTLRAEVGPER